MVGVGPPCIYGFTIDSVPVLCKLTKILYEISDLKQDFKISNKDLRKDFIIVIAGFDEINIVTCH